MHSFVRRFLRLIASILFVPILLFEEWGWEPLAALAARLARLPFWARLEDRIRALPPWAALLLFLVPFVAVLPIKLFAVVLLSRGHATSAVLLLLGVKLAGTALLARLFQLVEPALMRIPLFARWYPRWKLWKDQLLDRIRQSAPWRLARHAGNGARRWWRALRRTG